MGFNEKEINKRVIDLLELMQIRCVSHRSPYHLSGGEKRKVAIACVLSMNPEVLVLDEPINELDPRTQRWLVDLLIRLNQSGKTLITSTHNLELVPEISNRAILFDENHEILSDMPTERLLQDSAPSNQSTILSMNTTIFIKGKITSIFMITCFNNLFLCKIASAIHFVTRVG
jgi:cobalt/nickel transport system ATP-binding protein